MTTATARAFPNIALVKYWGKRDEQLIIPAAGSLSLTLDAYPTDTTVTLDPALDADRFELDGDSADAGQQRRVTAFLDHVRSLAEAAGSPHATTRAAVRSHNAAPTGAGLATSASGFAALAVSAAAAYGLDLDARALSRLARRGSGSASRSIVPGIAVWNAGHDDETSFAEPIDGPPLAMVIVTVDRRRKAVSSREAMRATALTSPYYSAWVADVELALASMREACRDRDFTRIGRITESNALRMHGAIEACDPPIRYLSPQSIAVFDAVRDLRDAGLECYATADAGPNVAVLVQPVDAERLAQELCGLGATGVANAGPGAALVADGAAS